MSRWKLTPPPFLPQPFGSILHDNNLTQDTFSYTAFYCANSRLNDLSLEHSFPDPTHRTTPVSTLESTLLLHEYSLTTSNMSTSIFPSNEQQLYVVTLCGINEKLAQLGRIDVYSSLFAANQNVRHRALHFKEETSLLMEKTASIQPDSEHSQILELRNGGKTKDQGVRSDGTAFWVGTKMGTKQLSPLNHLPPALRPPILEELINCKVSKTRVQLNGHGARKEVFVVLNVWTEVKGTNLFNGDPQADLEGVYATMQEANNKVKEVASAYAEKIRRLFGMFGWRGEDAAQLCSSKCTERPDGTLSWGGLREFKMDGSDPATGAAHVSAYKRVIDLEHLEEEEMAFRFGSF